ncbi:calcium channel protein [Mortierella sp. NVP85]|nr:calcium channel protein [Mortierella sp. NVP85]
MLKVKAQTPFLRLTLNQIDLVANEWFEFNQVCVGHYNASDPAGISSYLTTDGSPSPAASEGYLCPQGLVCKEFGVNKIVFQLDNMFSAMVQVYTLATGETWSDVMFGAMDTEYSWLSIYLVLVLFVMNFWILNLFVAVVSEAFTNVKEDTRDISVSESMDSKYPTNNVNGVSSTEGNSGKESVDDREGTESINNGLSQSVSSTYNHYKRAKITTSEPFWVVVIIADLVLQCLPQYDSLPDRILVYRHVELWLTVALAVDIITRFVIWLPEPKQFFRSKKNNVDLFLAIATLVILIPSIRNSHAYVYLSVFRIIRIYRPIILIERLRRLIQRIVRKWVDLLKLIGFIAIFLGVPSTMAGILFTKTDDNRFILLPGEDDFYRHSFSGFLSSYLGMLQILSGANWTDMLDEMSWSKSPWHVNIVNTTFVIAFYSFANFILANMVIAIISDNSEEENDDERREQQIRNYTAGKIYFKEKEHLFALGLQSYLKRYTNPVSVHYIPSESTHTMSKEITCEFFFTDEELFRNDENDRDKTINQRGTKYIHSSTCQGHSEVVETQDIGVAGKLRHRSFFLLDSENKLRRFCQRIVIPGKGFRIVGEKEDPRLSRCFNLFITLVILASVVVAVITTPVWRYRQTLLDLENPSAALDITDNVFRAIFTIEFLVRVIADGFILTPDAYLGTLWNRIDFFVLLSWYSSLIVNDAWMGWLYSASRFFRSLRVLRLINTFDHTRTTFNAVLVTGLPQLFDALIMCMALLVPFGIYGMHIFSGLFFSCNDDSEDIRGIDDCVGTYRDQYSGGGPIPRVWSNPHGYSFDNFWVSILTLYQVISQDAESDVMESAHSVMGLGVQPRKDVSPNNGIFFMVFNLVGGYFVMALFVAIVIENYTRRTGAAFMTPDQRRWMSLKMPLENMKMAKSRQVRPAEPFQAFCFDITSRKQGWFARFLTVVTILNGVLLAIEPMNSTADKVTSIAFLTFLAIYVFEIFAIIYGHGWNAYKANRWNLYNGTISVLALLATIMWFYRIPLEHLLMVQRILMTMILFRLLTEDIKSVILNWPLVREGWSKLMHDFAVEKPYCVKSNDYLQSDCGSKEWSYTLFISFNILSKYIFMNMIIVVVVHHFSYVCQDISLHLPNARQEFRHYKEAWAKVDMEYTGYIQKQGLARFLGKLRGQFDIRMYKEEHSLARLQSRLERSKTKFVHESTRDLDEKSTATELAGTTKKRTALFWSRARQWLVRNNGDEMTLKNNERGDGQDLDSKIHREYNLDGFNFAIAGLDKSEVRRRRRVYNFLYTEVVMSMVPIPVKQPAISMRLSCWFRTIFKGDPDQIGDAVQPTLTIDHEGGKVGQNPESLKGISFSKMLMILARYKLVEDESSFSIEEQLRHRQRMERLHPLVNEMVVKSLIRRIVPRWRFLKYCREVLSIQARIQQTHPPLPSTEHGEGDQYQPFGSDSGNGSGVNDTDNSKVQAVGSTQTRRRPPVWISSDNMALQTLSVERLLTPEEASVEIYNLRSIWKCKSNCPWCRRNSPGVLLLAIPLPPTGEPGGIVADLVTIFR